MALTVKQMMEAANAAVPKITPGEAREMIGRGNTLVVDVRDAQAAEELRKTGLRVHTAKSVMRTAEEKADLARAVLDAVGGPMAAHAGLEQS